MGDGQILEAHCIPEAARCLYEEELGTPHHYGSIGAPDICMGLNGQKINSGVPNFFRVLLPGSLFLIEV
jgi:hypothetical protein